MRARLTVTTALAAIIALSTVGHAAPAPQVKDAKGDALASQSALDIVSVQYSTTGKRAGRKYTPDTLVVKMTLAAAPKTSGGTYAYNTDASVTGCGYFQTLYSPGATLGDGHFFMECGSPADETGSTATLIPTAAKVAGNTITWSIKLRTLPKQIKVGSTWSGFNAYTDITEPVFGLIGAGLFTGGVDEASGTKSWKLG